MDNQTKQYRLSRARKLLQDIHHVAIATVNADSSPHCSPVLMAFDQKLRGYWVSTITAAHSQNILRDGRIFLSIFDSREGHSGLFLAGRAVVLDKPSEAAAALRWLERVKRQLHGGMDELSGYLSPAKQRIYQFKPTEAWVNHSDKRGGVVVQDRRYKIQLSELRAGIS